MLKTMLRNTFSMALLCLAASLLLGRVLSFATAPLATSSSSSSSSSSIIRSNLPVSSLSAAKSKVSLQLLKKKNNADEEGDLNMRRSFLATAASAAASAVSASILYTQNALADASPLSDVTDVYFGCGCFWHVQHEFVEAERSLLGRGDKELTSRTGYAGGKSTDKEGRVCYHNFQSIADYGKLGHGEVVGMTIPEDYIGKFAEEYFNLFTPRGERVDPMDKGGEYRSLLGLPGGTKHPKYPEVEAAAATKGMTLEAGKGNDPDTLGTKKVYIYDTTKYPFFQAEVYHQYHNDFLSPAYGKKYNDLVKEAIEDGRIKTTGCPDRI